MQLWALWAVLSCVLQGAAAAPSMQPGPGMLQLVVDEATGGRMAIAVAREACFVANASGPDAGAEAGAAPRLVAAEPVRPGRGELGAWSP